MSAAVHTATTPGAASAAAASTDAQHAHGIGRAHDAHMQLVRKPDIGDKGAPPGQQRRVFQPGQRLAENAVR